MSSTALADLERAPAFGVNTLLIENDADVEWNVIVDGLAVYDFSDRHRRDAAGRARVETLRARYREITAGARRRGIDAYLMCAEVHVPRGFAPLAYDNPALWPLLRDRLREVFQALPDLAGFMVYFAEGQAEVADLPGGDASQAARYRKLIDTLWEACRAEKRKLLVTTFIHRPHKLEAIAEALRGIPPDPGLAVIQYCCPNDWGLYELVNPSLGRVGPHPEILAFDYAAENWGQGAHPFVQVEFMARRVREARAGGANLAGLAGYVAWYGRSALGTFNEASIHAGAALAKDPERDGGEILREWCAARFGQEGADAAAACLARTHPAVFKAQHVLGYWVDTGAKSGLPSLHEMEEYFIRDVYGEALGKWDPKRLPVWEKIQAPDETFLAEVLKEKEDAVALCRRSLEEVRGAGDRFRPEDARALERAFAFQELWARLWREQMHAFFLRRIGGRQGWTPELRARLNQALETMAGEATELETAFGKDVFPGGPGRARRFIREARQQP